MVLPLKRSGMDLPDLIKTANLPYSTSVEVTRTLTKVIQAGDLEAFDLQDSNKVGRAAKDLASGRKQIAHGVALEEILTGCQKGTGVGSAGPRRQGSVDADHADLPEQDDSHADRVL